MSGYRLTKRAEADLLDIFLFGLEQFGPSQAEAYAVTLERTFRLLADNPLMGRRTETIAPGVRRHEHASHVILYEVDGEGALIFAVVHGRSLRRLTL